MTQPGLIAAEAPAAAELYARAEGHFLEESLGRLVDQMQISGCRGQQQRNIHKRLLRKHGMTAACRL